jgi:hypothetical protein
MNILAAAHAEAGRFDKAVDWQVRAIELLPESEKEGYQSRLEQYRSGRADRDPPE